MRELRVFLLALSCFFVSANLALAPDYYIDADSGSDSNSGASPALPWKTISHALASVSGTQSQLVALHIAAGTYSASSNGESFPLQMKPWVSLEGAGPGETILDAESEAPHVLYCWRVSNLGVKGLQLTGGNASGDWPDSAGGGVLVSNGAVTIKECWFVNNSAASGSGGGAHLAYSSGDIIDCKFSDNSAQWGGAIAFNWSSPSIQSCVMTGNSASNSGGAIYLDNVSSPQIVGCEIRDNWARWGAAAVTGGGASPVFKNCLITENQAENSGGLIYCGTDASAELQNCTVFNNSAPWGAGFYCDENSSALAVNSIFWGNTPFAYLQQDASLGVTYSCVEGGWYGEGNIFEDPLFTSGPLGDYYLSSRQAGQDDDSPCIDAGSDSARNLGLDDKTTRADGVPDTGVVDLGYHYSTEPGPEPSISCSLNQAQFSPGEDLVASIEVSNYGQQVVVDVYVAIVMPNGAIICFTGSSFAVGLFPWWAGVSLPEGFCYGPGVVFQLTVPGGSTGDYLYAAALTEPGRLNYLAGPAVFPFSIGAVPD